MEQAKAVLGVYEWLTLAAIVLGPILAIIVTRIIDWVREKKARRLEIFKILMRTRGLKLSPDHVGALNLIEIEYYKETKVLDALEKYFQHLSGPQNHIDAGNWLQTADHLFTKLLSQMAKSLGYEIEQLQLLTSVYNPRAWEESENRQAEIQKSLLAVLKGQSAFPIKDGNRLPITGNRAQNVQFEIPPGFPQPPV